MHEIVDRANGWATVCLSVWDGNEGHYEAKVTK